VSIVQKLVIKLSNTSTMFSQQVEITLLKYLRTSFSGRHIITFNVILTITNAISKNLSSSCTKRLPIITYIHPLNKWMCTEIRLPKIFTALYLQSNLVTSSKKGILETWNLTPPLRYIPMHILAWTDCVKPSTGKISYTDIFSSSNLQK
jgi:hypothetical protein